MLKNNFKGSKAMNKVFGVLLALCVTFGFSTQANAANKLNPWTDCGIGAMIFTDISWAAAISNVIWDLGTTAVTSSGLSDHTCSGANAKVAMLIGTTYANLEEETVQGGGQTLNAMLNVMECKSPSHAGIIQAVRSDFVQSLQSDEYLAMSKQ
ncbi:MAG: DUF3015 family protein, partial [Gallionella sp.]